MRDVSRVDQEVKTLADRWSLANRVESAVFDWLLSQYHDVDLGGRVVDYIVQDGSKQIGFMVKLISFLTVRDLKSMMGQARQVLKSGSLDEFVLVLVASNDELLEGIFQAAKKLVPEDGDGSIRILLGKYSPDSSILEHDFVPHYEVFGFGR